MYDTGLAQYFDQTYTCFTAATGCQSHYLRRIRCTELRPDVIIAATLFMSFLTTTPHAHVHAHAHHVITCGEANWNPDLRPNTGV